MMVSTSSAAAHPEEKPFRIDFAIGEGFVLEKPDLFRFSTRLRAQFLYAIDDAAEVRQSLSLRRARITFGGYVFGKENSYRLELALSPRDMLVRDGVPQTTPILDFYFRFSHLRDLALQVGQYKVPFNRERLVSSANFNLVDRSLVSAEFDLDRDLGFDLRSKDLFGLGFLRYHLGIFIGEGRNTLDLSDFGNLYVARIEVLPLGLFDDLSEGDLDRSDSPKLSLGVAYAFVDDAKRERGLLGNRPADGGTTDTHNLHADLLFLFRGISLIGGFSWRNGSRNPGDTPPASEPRDAYGFFVQPGYLLPWFDLELVARFSRIIPFGDSSATLSSELGGGLNYYFVEHSMKMQADFFHLWRTNDLGNGSDVFRLQLQAAF
jgi:hypothetical protein